MVTTVRLVMEQLGLADPAEGSGSAEARRRRAQREERVAGGLDELERWLADQIRQGLVATRRAGPGHFDEIGRRMVDAQASGIAGVLSRLGPITAREDWPARLVAEYGLLHLLAVGHRRRAELPAELVATIRSRVGFTLSREEVLARPAMRDLWDVLGRRDEEHDGLVTRRVWLRGRGTGRPALVLSFAPVGKELDASLVTGTTVDAELAFYPGSSPLRALVARRHDAPALAAEAADGGPPPGVTIRQALLEVAEALAGDPWTDGRPLVLAGVVPALIGAGWGLADPETVAALPLRSAAAAPWRLIAVSGGRPSTVAAEWTPDGLIPLCTWDDEGRAVAL
jgi:hypothetical protein